MVAVRLSGGLGNQFFQYAIGRAVAAQHDVPLQLDISHYSLPSTRSFELDRFRIRAEVLPIEVGRVRYWFLDKRLLFNAVRMFEQLKRPHDRNFFFEKHFTYDSDVWNVSSSVTLVGCWQSFRYFDGLKAERLQDESG